MKGVYFTSLLSLILLFTACESYDTDCCAEPAVQANSIVAADELYDLGEGFRGDEQEENGTKSQLIGLFGTDFQIDPQVGIEGSGMVVLIEMAGDTDSDLVEQSYEISPNRNTLGAGDVFVGYVTDYSADESSDPITLPLTSGTFNISRSDDDVYYISVWGTDENDNDVSLSYENEIELTPGFDF